MKLLFLCHADPRLQAGGTEIFAHDLFRALRARPGMTGVFVAGASGAVRAGSPGTPFQAVCGAHSDEVLLHTGGFDPFYLSQTDVYGVIPPLAALLDELRPDIVHIHHFLNLGLETVELIRRLQPRARIVMTLHDYYAICPNDGQMTTASGALCHAATPDACRGCFPERTLSDFRLRELHIGSALRTVDRFIAPSRFLLGRFLSGPLQQWNIPPERIVALCNGVPDETSAPHRVSHDGRRDRFGFFGHINRFKGATVALAASARLTRAGVAHTLSMHGGTAYQTQAVLDAFAAALADAADAHHAGPYVRADLARRMQTVDWVVVPSVWWENAPLVIAEAHRHRRPVICSDAGGMAEMVRDGLDGLHATLGDTAAFAETMRRGIEEVGLWDRLVSNITPPPTISAAADEHLSLYAALLAEATLPARSAAIPCAAARHQDWRVA